MKCTNKRSLALAALSLVLLAASLAAYFLQGRETRFLLSAGLALVWGLVQLYEAFHTKGAAELAAALADERDHYLAAKSSQCALRIFSYLLLAACFALLISYGLWKRPELLGALAALYAAAVVLFVLLLCVNIYYEKRG